MVTGDIISQAPAITFLWVKRFPLGFYPPAILPLLIVFSITSVETVGDVTGEAGLQAARIAVGNIQLRSALLVYAAVCCRSQQSCMLALHLVSSCVRCLTDSGAVLLTGLHPRTQHMAHVSWLTCVGSGSYVHTLQVLGGCMHAHGHPSHADAYTGQQLFHHPYDSTSTCLASLTLKSQLLQGRGWCVLGAALSCHTASCLPAARLTACSHCGGIHAFSRRRGACAQNQGRHAQW